MLRSWFRKPRWTMHGVVAGAVVLAVCNEIAWVVWPYGVIVHEFYSELYSSVPWLPPFIYVVTQSTVIHGLIFVAYAAAALWLSGAWKRRRIAALLLIVWGLAFGWWIITAAWWIASLFGAALLTDTPPPWNEWRWAGGHAVACLFAGVCTAGLAWWATGSRAVAGKILVAAGVTGLAMVLLWPVKWHLGFTGFLLSLAQLMAVTFWHGFTAAALMRWAQERRRQRSGLECLKCGYSLEGLTTPRCPECGAMHARPSACAALTMLPPRRTL